MSRQPSVLNQRCVFPPCASDEDCEGGTICLGAQCVEGNRGSCDPDVLVELDGLGVYEGTTEGARSSLRSGCAQSSASPEVAHSLTFDMDQTLCVSTEGSAFDTVAYSRTDCMDVQSQVACDDDGEIGEGDFSIHAQRIGRCSPTLWLWMVEMTVYSPSMEPTD